jgi:hypothetical protein
MDKASHWYRTPIRLRYAEGSKGAALAAQDSSHEWRHSAFSAIIVPSKAHRHWARKSAQCQPGNSGGNPESEGLWHPTPRSEVVGGWTKAFPARRKRAARAVLDTRPWTGEPAAPQEQGLKSGTSPLWAVKCEGKPVLRRDQLKINSSATAREAKPGVWSGGEDVSGITPSKSREG